jgi:diguanylate cyclase (GGDEF)-like protein
VLRPVVHARRGLQGYVAVAVDSAAVLASTLRMLAWLAASALTLFAVGLVIQQQVFWRTVGRPLAELVRTADDIQPDDEAAIRRLNEACARQRDDIGRLYCAFSRLMHRLADARQQLLTHNEHLETTVRLRTAELIRANAEMEHELARRRELEEELRRVAGTDALTGLANRGFILPYVDKRLAQSRRDGRQFGLMMFDLDHFKDINDQYGHAAGDEVLRVVSQRVQHACRTSDIVARLGGDEFLVAFEGFTERAQVAILANRIVDQFKAPIPYAGFELHVGASLGVATFPGDGGSPEHLIAAVDAAMYDAKHRGGGLAFAADIVVPPPRPGATASQPMPLEV